jgi:hypothetical protein
MKEIIILSLVFILAGCYTQKWFHNKSVNPNEQQMFYNQDNNYCQGVAAGTVPMPNVNFIQNQGYRTYGTATIYSQSSGYVNVDYQSQTIPNNNFTTGFQQGWQMGEAISAESRREKFAEACMFRLGWREIPCQTCIP